MPKGYTKGEYDFIESIPEALNSTKKICSSVNVASTKAGISMDAVAHMGRIIKKTAQLSKDDNGFACAKLVVFSNAVEDNPFMAGAFHGTGEGECVINVGVSGPGVVKKALEKVKGADFGVVADTIKKTAFKITRMGQLVATEAAGRIRLRRQELLICRSRPLRQSGTALHTFLKKWGWNAAALRAQLRRLRCLTTRSKKAA